MKYFSKKVKNEHGVFDSETEYGRFLFLKYLERNKEIKNLTRHVKFEILPKITKEKIKFLKTKTKTIEVVEERAKHYTCDFTYLEGGKLIIEEVKSEGTKLVRDYPLRKHLMKLMINNHNKEVGFDDWEFKEFIPVTTRTIKTKRSKRKKK